MILKDMIDELKSEIIGDESDTEPIVMLKHFAYNPELLESGLLD